MISILRQRAVQLMAMALFSLNLTASFSAVQAQSYSENRTKFENICSSIDRTQVDCACVGNRLATFLHVSPAPEFSAFTEANYRRTIGLRSDIETALEAAMGSDEKIMNLIAAYDPHGGHDIEYERGCVIESAPSTPIAPLPSGDLYQTAYNQCASSTGFTRYCQCLVAAEAEILTEQEFDANFVDEVRYQTFMGSNDEFKAQRALEMNISVAALNHLQSQASTKLNEYSDGDGSSMFSNECHAKTYGEDMRSGLVNPAMARSAAERAGAPVGLESIDVSAAPRIQTGQEFQDEIMNEQMDALDEALRMSEGAEEEADELLNSPILADIKDGSDLPSSSDVLATGCAGEEGRSPAYCECLATEFDSAVPTNISEGGRRMAAMMLTGSGLPSTMGAKISTNASVAEQREAAEAFPDIMDLPAKCEASARSSAVTEALAGTGSVRERYIGMCQLQFEGVGDSVCGCAADYYEKTLNENEWRMMIDIQVAELKGDDNAFEQYAENIGLTRQEAESAIISNPRLMQAMMGIGPACLSSGFGRN